MKALAILAALLSLTACGRVGPPRAPGPASAITYPRLYPAAPPAAGTVAPAAVPTPVEAPNPGPLPADAEQGNLPVARPGSPL